MEQNQKMTEKEKQQQAAKEAENEQYQERVKQVTPTHNLWIQMAKAFVTGGIICCIGQAILNYATNSMGLDK